ncbi:MAG: hypothetical protein SFX18_18910 [Pirellulales bacterium]|nr:hypothetical protein [Pirellulales bacterium]
MKPLYKLPRFRLLSLLLAFVVVAVGLWLGKIIYDIPNEYVFKEFDCGQGRRITIYGERFPDFIESFCYEVTVNDQVVIPLCSIGARGIGPYEQDFELITAEQGNLMAIIDTKQPYEFCIIHDFSSGDSWPHADGRYSGATPHKINFGTEILLRKRIEAEHPRLARRNKLLDEKYFISHDTHYIADVELVDTDLTLINENSKIDYLDLTGNQITDDGLINFRKLLKLKGLNLTENPINGTGFSYLTQQPLDSLRLRDTLVNDTGLAVIARLTTLRDLDLSGTQITDTGLAQLSNLQSLRFLYLENTNTSAAAVAQLRSKLPNTHIKH